MRITWKMLSQSLRDRHSTLQHLVHQLPQIHHTIESMGLSPDVRDAVISGLEIHTDNLIDSWSDDLIDEVNRLNEPRPGSQALTFVGLETRSPIDVHELLCKAIHEGDASALATLAGEVTDIQLT